MNPIIEKSPTRVDLAGGTLDCWPLYLFLHDPVTVNVAIDIFTYCFLQPRTDAKIILESEDLQVRKEYENLQAALSDREPAFDLYRVHLNYWKPHRGFELKTRSESPVGGGLGGSSSLCISMLKAFSRWLHVSMSIEEMVRIASHIEAQLLVKPTGTQDYFPPLTGGLCFIQYGVPGPRVEAVPIPVNLFKNRFLLVYTGRSHHSGINNWQVIKSYLDGDLHPKACLEALSEISKEMKQALLDEDLAALPALFQREYDARTQLSAGFSSPEIRKLQAVAQAHGAVAKICGAGGGGCVLIWCPEGQREQVAEACRRENFNVLSAQPYELLVRGQ